jgi:hypothetical protein
VGGIAHGLEWPASPTDLNGPLCDRLCLVLVFRGRYCWGGVFLLFILGSNLGGGGPVLLNFVSVRTIKERSSGVFGGEEEGWCEEWARQQRLGPSYFFHTISATDSPSASNNSGINTVIAVCGRTPVSQYGCRSDCTVGPEKKCWPRWD